jgi:hypothetical protein
LRKSSSRNERNYAPQSKSPKNEFVHLLLLLANPSYSWAGIRAESQPPIWST